MRILLGSLRGYQRAWLPSDLVAGFTVWAVLVPEALAYATIAGLPPVVGLYAAPPALILYAMLGSSRHLIVGPMSATAALSAGIVADVAGGRSADFVVVAAGLALVAGVVGIVAGLLRLGFLAGFISEPVLKGFIVGLALTIIAGQLPKLFGVEKADGNFFEQIWGLVTSLGGTNGWTLAIGAGSLVLVLGLKRFLPLLPASLVAVALGILVVAAFGLDDAGVTVVGHIDAGLPAVGVPDLPLSEYLSLVGGAAGIVLIGFAEGLGAAKTYAVKAGYQIDADRELLGLGAANIGSGLCSGMVVNGSLSKTAVNGGAGARSQVSGLIVAALTVVTLLFLTGLFQQLPEATLGAVVVAAVIELVDISALKRLYRMWTVRLGTIYGAAARADFTGAVAAMAGVLVFDTLPGLIIGMAISVLLLLYRASRPNLARLGRADGGAWVDVARHPAARTDPRVLVLRVESGLFFANSDNLHRRIAEAAASDGVAAVVLDAETVPFIDITAAGMLDELSDGLTRSGVVLYLAKDIGQVRDVLSKADDELSQRVYGSVDDAVAAAESGLQADPGEPGAH